MKTHWDLAAIFEIVYMVHVFGSLHPSSCVRFSGGILSMKCLIVHFLFSIVKCAQRVIQLVWYYYLKRSDGSSGTQEAVN